MPLQIALLGWGSLLWDGGMEFDRWHDEWKYDGPSLSLEFSRISESRLGALTLVVDLQHGVPNTVAWCLSKRKTAEDAIADLRCREGTTMQNIMSLSLAKPILNDNLLANISAWAKDRKLDDVVWTALSSNFKDKVNQPFSPNAAIAYLKGLSPEGKAKAAEYIWRAPNFVQTPLRSAMEKEAWFSMTEGN
jgi:hypothetical protein